MISVDLFYSKSWSFPLTYTSSLEIYKSKMLLYTPIDYHYSDDFPSVNQLARRNRQNRLYTSL